MAFLSPRLSLSAAFVALVLATPAMAHVVMAPTSATPGARVAARFYIGHGCGPDAPVSTALQVEVPISVTDVEAAAPPGWQMAVVRANGRISAVTWKGGEVRQGQGTLFPISFTVPKKAGALVFPAVQFCGARKSEWTQFANGAARLERPAPLLMVAATQTNLPGLTLSAGWLRALPANLPAGGYFNLRNSGAKTAVLTGAESPGCGLLMLHRTTGNGGTASMVHVPSLDVPAGGIVSFAPGSYHLMCLEPKAQIKPGNTVPVTLLFQGGGRVTADFAVRNAAGR